MPRRKRLSQPTTGFQRRVWRRSTAPASHLTSARQVRGESLGQRPLVHHITSNRERLASVTPLQRSPRSELLRDRLQITIPGPPWSRYIIRSPRISTYPSTDSHPQFRAPAPALGSKMPTGHQRILRLGRIQIHFRNPIMILGDAAHHPESPGARRPAPATSNSARAYAPAPASPIPRTHRPSAPTALRRRTAMSYDPPAPPDLSRPDQTAASNPALHVPLTPSHSATQFPPARRRPRSKHSDPDANAPAQSCPSRRVPHPTQLGPTATHPRPEFPSRARAPRIDQRRPPITANQERVKVEWHRRLRVSNLQRCRPVRRIHAVEEFVQRSIRRPIGQRRHRQPTNLEHFAQSTPHEPPLQPVKSSAAVPDHPGCRSIPSRPMIRFRRLCLPSIDAT